VSESLNLIYQTIDEQNAEKSAATRRQLVAGAATAIGGMGLLGIAAEADAAPTKAAEHSESIQTILNVAATAEVLATIVNTVAGEQDIAFFRGLPGDPGGEITRQNVRAAAVEELDHFNVLTSVLGARPVTRTIFVPNAYLANSTNLLSALEIGDEIFVNAYLIAVTVFGNETSLRAGTRGRFARIAAEFCGVEAIHRAAARQSLGKLGNDRVFLRYSQGEESNSPKPDPHQVGFRRVTSAVTQLQAAGFGFGAPGSLPGTAFDFDAVSRRTPAPSAVGGPLSGQPNTRAPR